MKDSRLTLGFLAYAVTDDVNEPLWQGIVDTARDKDVNLICLHGKSYRAPGEQFVQANRLYELLHPQTFDGVIVGSILREDWVSREDMQQFYNRLPGHVVSIRASLPGIPHISIDNYQGMRDAIVHLIEVHHRHRIAFLRGPAGHPYAEERYRAYVEVLQAYQLPLNSNLVTPPSDWAVPSLQVLLDERHLRPGHDFDAVVASNDDVKAFEALNLLVARGIRVPQDVAVIGYDDVDEGGIVIPPLTTVRPPFYELGCRAVQLLLDRIAGHSVPQSIALPAQLVVRQSCGCFEPSVIQAAAVVYAHVEDAGADALRAHYDEILTAMAQPVGHSDAILTWLRRVLDGFLFELDETPPNLYLETWNEVLSEVLKTGGSLVVWQDVVSILRRMTLPYLADPLVKARTEDLWEQVRVLMSDMLVRERNAQQFRAKQQAQCLRTTEEAILTVTEFDTLPDVLSEEFPRIGIAGCYLIVYDQNSESLQHQDLPEWSRCILAYNEQGRSTREHEGRRFATREFFFEEFCPKHYSGQWQMEALYCQDRPLGYILLAIGPRQGSVYTMLQTRISTALHGVLAVQTLRERSAELVRQQYILDTFLENAPDAIYFKDREHRIIRSNKAHTTNMGFSDPAEMVGKTDFDFFPEALARNKSLHEQTIMRTGQPLLNLEESGFSNTWRLTSKMPLRDEHGGIIGTFGISRDITALKRAQEALEQAYADIEHRVKERTAELHQEIAQRIQAEEAVRALNAELEQRVQERTANLEAVNKELESFAYVVSHDLKVPLRGITHLADWLTKDYAHAVDAAGQEMFDLLLNRVKRLDSLIDGILQYSRAGWVEEEMGPVNLQELVPAVIDNLNVPEHIRIAIINEFPTVLCNLTRLFQVFQNLLNNAVKFLDKPVGDIRIGCRADGAFWVFSIADNGPGIEARHQEQIFRLFQTLTSQTDQASTGIGLALVKRIVELYGGRIWVTSTPGAGTTFFFTLPRT